MSWMESSEKQLQQLLEHLQRRLEGWGGLEYCWRVARLAYAILESAIGSPLERALGGTYSHTCIRAH